MECQSTTGHPLMMTRWSEASLAVACGLEWPRFVSLRSRFQRTGTSGHNRVMIHRAVIPYTAMSGPQPSSAAIADPRTVQLARELLKRTVGRRPRCRRCRSVVTANARNRCQAWSVCTPCARAIKDDTHQVEIAPALLRRCLVCQTDLARLRAGARTCGDACRNVLSRLLRSRRHSVP